MLEALGMMMKSEYGNAGELLGLDGEVSSELLGYLNSLDAVSRSKVISKMSKKQISSQGSRAEFEKFFPELPKHIKEALLQGKLRLADHAVYSMKYISGAKTIKMFESQDVKENGIRNISNAKLPKNMALLVSGIYLLQGVSASNSQEDLKVVSYEGIESLPALVNGEFKLKANKKQLVSETSNRKFVTQGFALVPKGYFKLANPRLIHDDIEIEFELELGTVAGIDSKAAVMVILDGTATIP